MPIKVGESGFINESKLNGTELNGIVQKMSCVIILFYNDKSDFARVLRCQCRQKGSNRSVEFMFDSKSENCKFTCKLDWETVYNFVVKQIAATGIDSIQYMSTDTDLTNLDRTSQDKVTESVQSEDSGSNGPVTRSAKKILNNPKKNRAKQRRQCNKNDDVVYEIEYTYPNDMVGRCQRLSV